MASHRQRIVLEVQSLWVELDELVTLAETRPSRLSVEDWAKLGSLYRRGSAHLPALAKDPLERRRAQSLNTLLIRAHGVIYQPPSRAGQSPVWTFISEDIPRHTRALFPYHIASALLFFFGVAAGWIAVELDPETYSAFVPFGESRNPHAAIESLAEVLVSGRAGTLAARSAFASRLWINNTKVSFLALTSGARAGVPTVLILIKNGILMGARSQVYAEAGLGLGWAAWLAGHGMTAMFAIILAGGAGLSLGVSLLGPGDLSRIGALKKAMKPALSVGALCIPMLFFAALLEAFFRQSHAGEELRFAVGVITLALWLAYLGVSGKGQAPTPLNDPAS